MFFVTSPPKNSYHFAKGRYESHNFISDGKQKFVYNNFFIFVSWKKVIVSSNYEIGLTKEWFKNTLRTVITTVFGGSINIERYITRLDKPVRKHVHIRQRIVTAALWLMCACPELNVNRPMFVQQHLIHFYINVTKQNLNS